MKALSKEIQKFFAERKTGGMYGELTDRFNETMKRNLLKKHPELSEEIPKEELVNIFGDAKYPMGSGRTKVDQIISLFNLDR